MCVASSGRACLTQLQQAMAVWALRHKISTRAAADLLQEQERLFKRIGLLSGGPSVPPQISNPSSSWPRSFESLMRSATTKEELHLTYYAMCPNRDCGHMLLLGPTRKLQAAQKCQRPLNQLTEQPLSTILPATSAVCGAMLTKERSQQPLLLFSYRSLTCSLQQMVARPSFASKCEQWRECYDPVTHKLLPQHRRLRADIWHGDLWECFQHLPPRSPTSPIDYIEAYNALKKASKPAGSGLDGAEVGEADAAAQKHKKRCGFSSIVNETQQKGSLVSGFSCPRRTSIGIGAARTYCREGRIVGIPRTRQRVPAQSSSA